MSLLNFDDPQQAGLLAFAQNMFAAGAPQTRRVGIGQALTSGLSGMQQAQQAAELAKRQKQEEEMMMQMQQMKFGQMQQEMMKQKAMEEAMVNYAKFKQGGMQPAPQQQEAPSSVQGFAMPSAQGQNDRVTGNYQQQMPAPQERPQQAPAQQGFSKSEIVKAQIAELVKQAQFFGSRPDTQSQILAQQAQEKVLKLANELPKFANDYRVGRDKKGNLVNIRLADDGTEEYSPTQVAEELHFSDNGQQLLASGKYSGNAKVVSQKFQTPESIASGLIQMRGQNMTDTRARELNQMTGSDGGISQAGFNKQFGKPPAGFRWKNDGSMEAIPGGPADQKAQLQQVGAGTVAGVVADLRDKYNQLNEGGGIVNQDRGAMANLGASFGASSLGQTLGGAVGTKNQTARDTIAMTRPLLLQSIMKATGMSAKQMDSNAELKMYLATATDPTKGYQANVEALDRIEKLYGGGNGKQAGGKTVVKTGMYGGKKVYQYSDGSVDYGN
jgi:hypothetical protein